MLHGKNSILSDRSDFHMIDNLSIVVCGFTRRILMSLSVDKTLLPRWVNLSTNFRELPFRVEMSPSWLKHVYSLLSAFAWRPMPLATCSRLCRRDSAWVGVCKKCYVICIVCICNSFGGVSSSPGGPWFNPWLSHTKDSKNGTWCLLA